ncbi:hypothetical protein BgiBS90_021514 [Biomphalaria glabrata]|nr:hypothetical protein BgiBS90_021514 [Biomphalaria glabrata]
MVCKTFAQLRDENVDTDFPCVVLTSATFPAFPGCYSLLDALVILVIQSIRADVSEFPGMPSGQDHSCPQSDWPAYEALSLEKSQGLLVQFGRKDSHLTPAVSPP